MNGHLAVHSEHMNGHSAVHSEHMNGHSAVHSEHMNGHSEHNICMCKDSIICYCVIIQKYQKKILEKNIQHYPDYISGRGCDTA